MLVNDFNAASSESRPRQSRVQGERRIITILFCDVASSTLMAEQLDPEEWAEIMNEAFDHMIAPVYRYGGTVARLMGDAILAFFGAPIAHEDDPQRALLAGLEIVEQIRPFCEDIKIEYGLNFDVRIGINTGPVVVGEIGSDQAGEYTAMGDAVNVAARMEQTAQPGTVHVAEDTYRLVAPLFDFEALGVTEVKGKQEPVPTYRALRRKTEPGSLRGIEGLPTPLIGRDREMETLRRIVDEVRGGSGQIVFVVGEAGLGKSRLINETQHYWRETARPNDSDWEIMRSLSYESNRPYGLFDSNMRRHYGVTYEDSPEMIREKIAAALADFPDDKRDQAIHVTQLMLAVARKTDADNQHKPEGEAFKGELFGMMREFYINLVNGQPTGVVIDDLHWTDAASTELLLHLLTMLEQVPLLVICAMRPERDTPGWQLKNDAQRRNPDRFTEIHLSPLTHTDSDTLVTSLLSIADIPAGLREKILQKTDGNPFFVEEVVRTLIDNGVVIRDADGLHWSASQDIQEIDIPDNVQALVLARIDRLEAEVRQTLQVAAVVGRSFYYRVLDIIANMSNTLDQHILALQNVELIYEATRDPELEYMFTHELTRDAAYSSILHRRRREFHRRVAEAIERLFPERREEEAHRLAYHFREGRNFDRALEYYRLAGDVAARLTAHAEAATHYQEAIEIAQGDPAKTESLVELYQLRGRSLELRNRFQEALATYQALETLADERGDRRFKQVALMRQAAIHAIYTTESNPEVGFAQAEQALALARELNDRRAEAKTLWVLGLLQGFRFRKMSAAIDLAEQALVIAREENLREDLAYILHDLANAYSNVGRREEAITLRTEAKQLWREMGNLNMLSDALASGAWDYHALGDVDQGIRDVEEALRISESIDNAWGQGHSLNTLAALYALRGDLAKALRALEDSLPVAEIARFEESQMSARALLTLFSDIVGDYERGLSVGQELLDRANREISGMYRLYAAWLMARLLLHSGDREKSEAMLTSLLSELTPDQYAQATKNAYYVTIMSEIAIDKGENSQVGGMIDQFVNDPAYGDDEWSLVLEPELYYFRGKALLNLGQLEDAVVAFKQALSISENLSKNTQVNRWTENVIFLPNTQRVLWRVFFALGQIEAQRGNNPDHYFAEARALVETMVASLDGSQLKQAFMVQDEIKAILEL